MNIRQITENYSVTGQISVEDVANIKDAGFKTVISNRPDSEDGAIPHDAIESAVRAAGLEFRYIPVISGQVSQENIDQQAKALAEMPAPVLAYCRSGGRCANLHALVHEQQGDPA